jgi:hypothetical protein
MLEELRSIERNGTWTLVSLPPGKKFLSLKWLLKTKVGSNGELLKYKERLVAKGYSQ